MFCFIKKPKIKIYVDIDDCIINTVETTVKFLNEKLNIEPPKSAKDVTYYSGFKEIGEIHISELEEYWETNDFFNNIELDKDFLEYFKSNVKNFNWEFLTIGTKKNLSKKYKYLKKQFQEFLENKTVKYTGLLSHQNILNKSNYIKKYKLQDQFLIQIDDNYDNLKNSQVDLKILIKNYYDREYNKVNPGDNVYIVNTWREIIEILNFYNSNYKKIKNLEGGK